MKKSSLKTQIKKITELKAQGSGCFKKPKQG